MSLTDQIQSYLSTIGDNDLLDVRFTFDKQGSCRNVGFNTYLPKTRARGKSVGCFFTIDGAKSSCKAIVNEWQYNLTFAELGCYMALKRGYTIGQLPSLGLGSEFRTQGLVKHLIAKGYIAVDMVRKERGRFSYQIRILK